MRLFPDWVDGDMLGLDSDTFHHVVVVQRTRVGELVSWVTNGGVWQGQIVSIHPPDQIRVVHVTAVDFAGNAGPHWTVIQCLPKGDKFSEIIRGLIECGVNRIIPVMATRSIGKASREDRWQRIVKSAAMQSKVSQLPVVTPVMSLEKALQQGCNGATNRVVAWEEAPLGTWPTVQSNGDWVVMIGPEGGLTAQEIATATQYGYQLVSLGESIMRVERAGVVAVSMFKGFKMGVGIATNSTSS